ncbi:MAG: XRE family transcriptional regulator [Pseudomonadota bacterium]
MFVGNRLRIARQRRHLTKKQLGEAISVEARAVSGYEAGEYQPADATVDRLAKFLEFPRGFFFRDEPNIPDVSGVSFRSLSRRTAKQRDAAVAAGAFAYELIDWVEERFDLPDIDVPDLSELDPEAAAIELRTYWSLGFRPIKNVVHLLELHGVRVFSLSEENLAVDAYSIWRGKLPCVFLNNQKSSERSRFDAAHELGHLVLHQRSALSGNDVEKDADAFASNFLMPKEEFLTAGRISNISEMMDLKQRWGVSLAAAIFRAYRLQMISKYQYETMFKEISVRGWRKSEPNSMKRENSQVWKKVMSSLSGEGVWISHIAQELDIPEVEIVKLIFGQQRRPDLEVAGDPPKLRLVSSP